MAFVSPFVEFLDSYYSQYLILLHSSYMLPQFLPSLFDEFIKRSFFLFHDNVFYRSEYVSNVHNSYVLDQMA